MPLPWIYHMAASGNHVYAVDGMDLYVIDVSDRQAPFIAATYTGAGSAQGVAVFSQYAFVASANPSGMIVLDISNPASPLFVRALAEGAGNDVAVAGGYVCVADEAEGLTLFNIQNPSSPVLTADYQADYAFDLLADGDYCGVLDQLGNIRILDLRHLTSPLRVGALEGPGPGANLAMTTTQDRAYIATHGSLSVLDISNPTSPTTVGTICSSLVAYDLAVSGDIAALAVNGGLSLVDFSNPAVPTLAGHYDTGRLTQAVAMLDANTCVMDRWQSLLVIDVSDPSSPILIGELWMDFPMWDIAISGQFAYLANGVGGLKVVDLSDPTAPVLAGQWAPRSRGDSGGR